jgi:hypothetical protein
MARSVGMEDHTAGDLSGCSEPADGSNAMLASLYCQQKATCEHRHHNHLHEYHANG